MIQLKSPGRSDATSDVTAIQMIQLKSPGCSDSTSDVTAIQGLLTHFASVIPHITGVQDYYRGRSERYRDSLNLSMFSSSSFLIIVSSFIRPGSNALFRIVASCFVTFFDLEMWIFSPYFLIFNLHIFLILSCLVLNISFSIFLTFILPIFVLLFLFSNFLPHQSFLPLNIHFCPLFCYVILTFFKFLWGFLLSFYRPST